MARGGIELPTRGFSVAAVAGTIVTCAREQAQRRALRAGWILARAPGSRTVDTGL